MRICDKCLYRDEELEHSGEIGMAQRTAEQRILDVGVSAAYTSNSEGSEFLQRVVPRSDLGYWTTQFWRPSVSGNTILCPRVRFLWVWRRKYTVQGRKPTKTLRKAKRVQLAVGLEAQEAFCLVGLLASYKCPWRILAFESHYHSCNLFLDQEPELFIRCINYIYLSLRV